MPPRRLNICAMPGDGLGRELVPAALTVLAEIEQHLGGYTLAVETRMACGAAYHVARALERAIEGACLEQRLRPMEFGGDQGLTAALAAIDETLGQELSEL